MELIFFLVEDAFDAGIDQHLQAVDARSVSHVDIRVADAHPVLGRLGDRVDLGMDGAVAVLLNLAGRSLRLVDQAPDLSAVRQARWSAVVTGSQDVLLADDHRANLGPTTRRALGHLPGDREEILIPREALV